jgi:hypothetical protein
MVFSGFIEKDHKRGRERKEGEHDKKPVEREGDD